MPYQLRVAVALAATALAACGGAAPAPTPHADIRPQDFALVPCGHAMRREACALAIAGGKRVLFGAPAGVSATLSEVDLAQLDAVMVFSLRGVDIEGLDEVRNASWNAGRQQPLLVFGPDGTEAMGQAINLAFEAADALRVVEEGMPPGGFDAALLDAGDVVGVNRWQRIFDTGDFTVDAHENRDGYVDYIVTYQDQIGISACREEPPVEAVDALTWIGCGPGDAAWPLRHVRSVYTAP